MENETRIQGIVLEMSEESQKDFDSKIKEFLNRPDNLRKNIRIHLSLTLFAIQEREKLLSLKDLLEAFFSNIKAITINTGLPEMKGDNYIAIAVISKELIKLHHNLLEYLQPYVHSNFNPKYLKHNLSNKENEYLHKYSYHRVKEFFAPHITIGHYNDKNTRDVEFKFAPKIEGMFTFNKVNMDDCIDRAGMHSTIIWEKNL